MNHEDKQTRVRNWLLEQIDSGRLAAGQKLPGARDIAGQLNVSLLTVQNAIETLVNEGVLETFSRKGTFVAMKWNDCVLQYNFRPNNPKLPWLPELKAMVHKVIPKLFFSSGFKYGMLELRPTLALQAFKDDYLDMRELFDRCFPDKSDFFMEAFSSYYSSDGKLPGVPFIFSPRVMFYNTDLLTEAGCKIPRMNWTWNEFIDTVKKLKKILPADRIFNWNVDQHQWMGYIFRAGGCLFDPADKEDPVRIDHPVTRRGLKMFKELHELLDNCDDTQGDHYRSGFGQGKNALMMAPREDLYFISRDKFDNWGTVNIPVIDNGKNLTTQAADLICVRKTCSNLKMAEDFLKFMLSEKVQDFIGSQKYGIPIRKSSAHKCISPDNPRDYLFIEEIPQMSAQYNLDSAEISNMVIDGINLIWTENSDIDELTSELASAVRTFLKIREKSCCYAY